MLYSITETLVSSLYFFLDYLTRGMRVTHTLDVLTNDVPDLAIGLILVVLRKLL
jgi:hypothetical protein